jgi:hypothetical protein
MANQIIIDIGAVANDGTGDPLRTAFDYVNDNFSNIWATGVANSNIAFSGNRILTVNTNGNLVLAPNGTGKVQSNVDIIPNATNTLNLGSLTRKWNTVYTQYLSVGGNIDLTGDLTVDGNLTVNGTTTTINTANVDIEDKVITIAYGSPNAAVANGSGITVAGADANIIWSNISGWTVNDDLSVDGNVVSDTVITNNIRSDDSAIILVNDGLIVDGALEVHANITAPYFVGNGSQLTGITSYANANAVSYGQAGWAGNIIPSGNLVYSLGNATNRWNDLWLSGNTIQLGDLSLSASANGLTSTSGFNLANSTAANIEATGNITANNFVATEWIYGNIGVETHQVQFTDTLSGNGINLLNNGGFLVYESNLGSAGGFVPSADDSESIGQSDRRWATVYANAFIGNTQGLVGNITNLDSLNFSVGNISALVGNNGVNIGAGGYNNLVVLPTEVLIQNVPLTVAGNILSTVAGGLNITANTVANGVAQIWNFGTDGDLTVPGNIVSGNARISLQEPSFDSVYITPVTDDTTSITLDPSGIVLNCAVGMTVSANTAGNVIAWSFNDEGAFGLPYGGTLDNDSTGDVELRSTNNMSFEANAVVNIYTDTSGTAYQWQFDTTGNLTLPGGGSIIVDGGDGVIGPDGDNMVISWDNEDLILRSVGSDVDVEADRDFNIRVNYDVGATDYLTKWVFGQDNEIINISGNSAIITEAGNLNLQGGRNTLSSGNVQITAVDNGVAVNTWTFDNTGNLTVPGNIVMPPGASLVGNGASPAPSISGFSNGGFGGNVSVTGNITGGNLSVTGNISGNTAGYAIGYRDIPQVSFTGNATIATTDAGKHFYSTQSSNYTLTIANNASQGFQVGAAITVVNQGTGTITVAQGSGVTLYLAGNATSGNRSVATFGMATIIKVATDTWFINGTGVS